VGAYLFRGVDVQIKEEVGEIDGELYEEFLRLRCSFSVMGWGVP